MRVLVSGATGLVGQKLCLELLKKNHDLVVVGRSPENKFRERFSLPCDYISWNKLDSLDNIDAVFHLAGDGIADGRWSAAKKQRILDSRVSTTKQLVEAFEKSGAYPQSFISASAIGYYGSRGDEELYEDSPPGEGFLPDVCVAWENASKPLAEKTRLCHLRIGIVLDPEGGFLEKMEPLFSLGVAGRVGAGKQWMSWIHIQDLVNLFIFSLENKNISGAVNATAPDPVSNQEFTKSYAKQMGVWAPFPAPAIALKLALGEMSQLALNSQRVLPKKVMESGFQFGFANLTAALADLYSWKKKANERLFKTTQWLPQDVDSVFQFFCEAKNLEKITPPWLNFKVERQSTPEIQSGTIIDYSLKLHGIPLRWQTEILNWNPPREFTDNQNKGPYTRWHHTHSFEQLPKGTFMSDAVIYQPPFGRLGHLLAGWYVKKDVKKIFTYRFREVPASFLGCNKSKLPSK